MIIITQVQTFVKYIIPNYYERFQNEIKLLYELEPFWRTCLKCPDGYCCTQQTYKGKGYQGNPYLLEDWWLMLQFVRDNFLNEEKIQLIKNIRSNRKNCIFLFDKRCSIHSARPWTSRIHPYTVSFHTSPGLFPM